MGSLRGCPNLGPIRSFIMIRRDFIKICGIGFAAILLLATLSLFGSPAHGKNDSGTHPNLEEITVKELQTQMKAGKLTAKSLVQHYLQRIKEIDKSGPALNSILELNPDALKIAEALDKERKTKGPRGPLHGIPVVIKANIDTKDKMTTTAGSLALAGSIAPADAFLVEQLRKAGAVILAKANLSEWANFRSMRSSSGWSSQGGQTRNPYWLDRSPCGSSAGSAVAASANLCTLAIGTETDGSVVCPSAMNGVVGIKPTIGLVSRSGIIPISHSQDTAGPMARTVTDAALLLNAITGYDPNDPVTKEGKQKGKTDYTASLDKNGLKGARIGVVRSYFGFHEKVDAVMDKAIADLKAQGAIIIDPAPIETARKFGDAEFEVLLYEFKHDLNKYLQRPGMKAKVKSLEEIIQYNEKHRDKIMPYFEQELMHMAQSKGDLTDPKYLEAKKKAKELSGLKGIDATMDKHKLDALIAPTNGLAWKIDLITGDHFAGGSSDAAAVSGYPNITVPAGNVFDLPIGLSFFGRAFSEPTLLKLAYAYEQATKHRTPPRYKPAGIEVK